MNKNDPKIVFHDPSNKGSVTGIFIDNVNIIHVVFDNKFTLALTLEKFLSLNATILTVLPKVKELIPETKEVVNKH